MICALLLLAGCAERAPSRAQPATEMAPVPTAAPTPAPLAKGAAPTPEAQPARPGPPEPPEPKERPDGPTRAMCDKAAAHLGEFVKRSMVAQGSSESELSYASQLVARDLPELVRFCVEAASREEIDCVLAAQDFPTLAACERFRRQVPKDLADRDEVSESDCAKLFERLRRFRIEAGALAADIDATRDQVIRACLEKAKPGTVACFITARTYEEARRCP